MATKGLTQEFLAPYYKRGDCFPNLMSRSTYMNKYSRNKEVWSDTILRCVIGNCALDPSVTQKEMELLFHVFWTMQGLPPGRGLWTGGVPGIPAAARYNCWYATIRDYNDWGWVAEMLMLGGGVGVGLGDIGLLPYVSNNAVELSVHCSKSHGDFVEVNPDTNETEGELQLAKHPDNHYFVDDSRQGWVHALLLTLKHAFEGKPLFIDVSYVRCRGSLIKTFGGIASGPGPLVELLRAVWAIVRSAAGRKMSSVDCLDVTNHIGKCIKSGNVRRSALIALGDPHDQEFRDAKKDWKAVESHRHTSNNSLVFRKWSEFDNFNWDNLVNDNISFGEPGILNLVLGRLTDPEAMGVNPCGEQLLHDFEACNLAEVFPAMCDGSVPVEDVFKLVARYCIRQRLDVLHEPRAEATRTKNMRIGVGIGGICDFPRSAEVLQRYFRVVREEANSYADSLGVARPLTVTTVKPSGTISLLNGSSPGLHAPFDEYYIRRTRIAQNDAMAVALVEAGVPFEYCNYDKSGRTLAFMFPMKAKHTRITVQTETVKDQFQRQLMVQDNWADNAVSSTISFNKDNPKELADCLREYAPRLKSTSVLPTEHGYTQPPYESISRSRFEELSRGIDTTATLTRDGTLDIDDCAGGACPVR